MKKLSIKALILATVLLLSANAFAGSGKIKDGPPPKDPVTQFGIWDG